VISSYKAKINLPPSKAGKGKRLTTARFNDKRAINSKTAFFPNLATSEVKRAIPIGPATSTDGF
jgi:hypothetical protein